MSGITKVTRLHSISEKMARFRSPDRRLCSSLLSGEGLRDRAGGNDVTAGPTRFLISALSVAAIAMCPAAAHSSPVRASLASANQREGQQAAPGTTRGMDGQPIEPASPLFQFRDADIKFDLRRLMYVLRDRDHEGWVLAAYPDPNTGRPLIGAGFSLDVPATEHTQLDPLNPYPFVEPSSAQLWQAAGLEAARLQEILDQFHNHSQTWSAQDFRRQIHALPPQLTEQEAMRLLRISAIQAVTNAKAYCRNFDRLSASQQMALSQLVFQMGVNLEQFVEFLSAINGDSSHRDLALPDHGTETETTHWKEVQAALIDSRWARLYAVRAVKVIAMFDPAYARSPYAAERKIEAILRPPGKHRRSRAATMRAAKGRPHGTRTPSRRKLT
jgi:hypothetical protein